MPDQSTRHLRTFISHIVNASSEIAKNYKYIGDVFWTLIAVDYLPTSISLMRANHGYVVYMSKELTGLLGIISIF